MNFLERLMQGIDARFDGEQERQRREIVAEIAKREAEMALVKEREKRSQEGSFVDPKQRQKLEAVLQRFSVKERLEAIRDGVWKVGEVEPDYAKHTAIYKPPVLNGYNLEYRYPALGHTEHPIAYGEGWTYTSESAINGRGSFRVPGAAIFGFAEGENIDFIQIVADWNHDAVELVAASRLEVGTVQERGGLAGLSSSEEFELPICRDLIRFHPAETYHYHHPEVFVMGFSIDTPVILEELLVDWCYELTKGGRLPLQSQKTKEEVGREVGRENEALLSSLENRGNVNWTTFGIDFKLRL